LENSNLENSSEILKNKLFETILDEIMPFTTSDFFLILNNKKNENHIFVKLRAKEKFLNTHKFNFESLLKRISQKEEKLISNSIIIYTYESNIDFESESNLKLLRIYKVIEICYIKREKDLAKHFYEFMNDHQESSQFLLFVFDLYKDSKHFDSFKILLDHFLKNNSNKLSDLSKHFI